MDNMDIKKRIMIVEDDKDINNLIAYNLDKEGFTVEQELDGSAAENRLKKESYDVVILDLMLPGADGFQICKSVKDNPEAFKTFVVIVSAKCANQDKLYAHLLGADYYLTKPFSVSKLMEIIKELAVMRDKEFSVNAHFNRNN